MTHKWHRWSGSPRELVRAINLAESVLSQWTDIQTVVTTAITDSGEVTETATGTSLIEELHPKALARVRSVFITLKPDRDGWWERRINARAEGKDPGPDSPPPDAKVTIKLGQYGTELVVEGEDRTAVEGLTRRLTDVLGRAATNHPGIEPNWFVVLLGPAGLAGALLALFCTRWLGLTSRDRRWEIAELFALIGGAFIGVGIVGLLWMLFPRLEMLGDGEQSRARRFRSAVAAASVALIVGVVGSFLYDQFG